MKSEATTTTTTTYTISRDDDSSSKNPNWLRNGKSSMFKDRIKRLNYDDYCSKTHFLDLKLWQLTISKPVEKVKMIYLKMKPLILFTTIYFTNDSPSHGMVITPLSKYTIKIIFASKFQSLWSKGKHSWLWIWRPLVSSQLNQHFH